MFAPDIKNWMHIALIDGGSDSGGHGFWLSPT